MKQEPVEAEEEAMTERASQSYLADQDDQPGRFVPATRRRLSATAVMAGLAVVVVLLVVAGVVVARNRPVVTAGTDAAPPASVAPAPRPPVIDDTIPLPEPGVDRDAQLRKSAEEHFAKLRDGGGWVPYSGTSAIPGDAAPAGWVLLRATPDQLAEAAVHGVPVYDEPNGTVIGYDFASLGYVPKATAEAPGFDPEALRQKR